VAAAIIANVCGPERLKKRGLPGLNSSSITKAPPGMLDVPAHLWTARNSWDTNGTLAGDHDDVKLVWQKTRHPP
jgi:hypothetical protein